MQDNGTPQDDELSFQDFKQQLQQLRLFLLSLFRLAIRSIKRYALLLLLLLAGFAAVCYFQYRNSKVFEARASYVYTELKKKTYGEMIDKLQEMIRAKSYNRLASALQITPAQARNVIMIDAENLFGSKLSEDITENNRVFYINVSARSNKLFDTLQGTLESYLNNNILVKETIDRKKKILQQKINYQQKELDMMDSLKTAYTRSLDKPSAAVYPSGNQFNPVSLYEKGEKINQDLADMKALLEDYRAVQTQDRFLVSEEPYGKSLLSFGLRYFALYLAACVVLLFILSIFRK